MGFPALLLPLLSSCARRQLLPSKFDTGNDFSQPRGGRASPSLESNTQRQYTMNRTINVLA